MYVHMYVLIMKMMGKIVLPEKNQKKFKKENILLVHLTFLISQLLETL